MDKTSMIIIITLCRGIKLESGLNKKEILEVLGEFKNDEVLFVEQFIQFTKNQTIIDLLLPFNNFEDKSFLKYLESVNYHSFPIQLSYLGINKKQIIMTYFYLNRMKTELPNRTLTEEQFFVVNTNENLVVNAGPGTGKTTTACTKAYQLSKKGRKVLFISYTNAAVKEDKIRMLEYPYEKENIIFSTIDSLAGKICASILDSYDHNIREAISKIESKNRIPFKLNDVIIDEAQDIDNLRFELIFKMLIYGYFETLTIFGDPRQRIKSGAGLWYYDMWKNTKNNLYYSYGVNIDVIKVGFTYSQRFNNSDILDLVNNLSQIRQEIHYQLVSGKQIETNPAICIMNNGLDEIVKFIEEKISIGYKYSDFMFISPSINSDNKTSKNCQKVSSYLRYANIPCKNESQGSFHPNAILFTTIQSSKGKEAEFIFLLGMNNYSNNFNMIPKDEIESLIFVAHSRAKTKIIYVIDGYELFLPKGVSKKYLDTSNFNTSMIKENFVEDNEDLDFKFSISSLSDDHDLNKLLQTNNYTLNKQSINYNFQKMPERTDCLDFYGIITGLVIGIFCTMEIPDCIVRYLNGKYIVISDSEYDKMKKYNPDFINGFNILSNTLIIKKSEKIEIDEYLYLLQKPILEMTMEDFYKLAEIFVKITCGFKIFYNKNLGDELIQYWRYNAREIISKFGEIIGVEISVKYENIIGSIDLLTEEYIIELKTCNEDSYSDSMQVWLYKSCMNTKRIPIVLNLNKKTCNQIISNRNIDSWRYILSKFCQLKISQYTLNEKLNKLDSKNTFLQQNIFCVDTEFNTQISGEYSIFEISIFNCNDPFRSIISIVNNGIFNKIPCIEWLDIEENLYIDSPNIDTIRILFSKLIFIYPETPIIYYYSANTDISWLINKISTTNVDLSNLIKMQGYYESNIKKSKLIDLYNYIVDFIETRNELKHHTAFSDTIMLYEILLLIK